ncbi:MAG: rhodanese-like domain-containing protein [Planctomycetes bacterium]|nr:rhodanese-like domain-containing protein [Planctomycetota bacterium]
MSYRDLDPATAQRELHADPTLRILDVRTEGEHASHRLPQSTLIPVQELEARLGELDRDANWLVHCEHGRRSVWACEILAQAGFARLANLSGGLAWWAGCGLPLETGPRRG